MTSNHNPASNPVTSLSALTALTAMSGGSAVGLMGFILLPIWVGAAARHLDLDLVYLGWIATAHLGGVAVASLMLSVLINRRDRRLIALAGVLVAALGNGLSIMADTLSLMLAARIICGLGEGALLTAVSAAACATANPVRTFTVMELALTLVSTLAYLAMPWLIGHYGAGGPFGIMLVLELACFALLFALPPRPTMAVNPVVSLSLTELVRHPLVLVSLVAYTAFYVADATIWPFIEAIGAHAGLALHDVTMLLALASLLTIAGPVAAHVLGLRLGRVLPIVIAIFFLIVNAQILTHIPNPYGFGGSLITFTLMVMFVTPYLMELFAWLDPGGRVAGAAPAFMSIGNALGPLAAALVLTENNGFGRLGLIAGGFYILSLIVFVFVAKQADHQARAKA